MLKDAKTVYFSDLQGHCILTPGQVSDLLKRMKTPRVDKNEKMTDERLLDAWHWALERTDPRVSVLWSQIEKGVEDPTLTKYFVNWENTYSQLDNYLTPEHSYNFGRLPAYRDALDILSNMFSGLKLKPLPVYAGMDTSLVWNNKQASAGAIGKGSKEDNEVSCFKAFNLLKQSISTNVPFQEMLIPVLPAHRAQISGFYDDENYDNWTYTSDVKQKDRLVWIVDGGTTLLEGQYAVPLQKWLSNNLSAYAGGKDPTFMRSFMSQFRDGLVKWVSIDYSKYDSTVPQKVIHDVFKNIIRPMFPSNCEQELKYIEYNFIHTKILLPGNRMVQKHRGIPSGSMFTQIVGTLCNILMGLTFICRKSDAKKIDSAGYVYSRYCFPGTKTLMLSAMGDDNIWGCVDPIDLKAWSEYVGKVFGLKIHPHKCATSRDRKFPEYLKREWTTKGEKMNLVYLLLNTSHPEHYRTYKDYSPWHILFGLVYCYRGSFFNASALEELIVLKMKDNGGLEALLTLNPRELPGVMRGYSDKARMHMYMRAKAIATNLDKVA